MENTKKVLTEDEKAVLLKACQDLNFANKTLFEWMQKDTLSEEMTTTLPALIESHFCDIAKILGYDSHLAKEQEQRYAEIRNANEKIRALEAKLGSEKPVDGLKEQLRHLRETVSTWWGTEGFNHVSEEHFTPYGGLHVQFHFMLDSLSSRVFSKSPVTDKKSAADRMQAFREQGFQFADSESDSMYRRHLLDNDRNRRLLVAMLQERFPSIHIERIENRCSGDTGNFLIWHLDAIIYDLTDI